MATSMYVKKVSVGAPEQLVAFCLFGFPKSVPQTLSFFARNNNGPTRFFPSI